MNGLRLFVGLMAIFILTPIWYYLLFKILQATNATDLMWFLYWVYVPVGIVVGIAGKLAEKAE
jgi:hypothetical protein